MIKTCRTHFSGDFDLPPDFFLDVRSGTHAAQTARIMEAYEKVCLGAAEPDLVIVVGDVNSTMPCALTAKKRNLLVAHLERLRRRSQHARRDKPDCDRCYI